PFRTLEDAVRLRNHLLQRFEQAVWTKDPQTKQLLLTFTIVGGGATGVELAGALSELIQTALIRDYPELAHESIRVCLLHSGDRLMQEFIPRLGQYTAKTLRRMGVEVLTGVKASAVAQNQVILDNGQCIETATVIWTAGVSGQVPNSPQELPFGIQQKLETQPTLQLANHPEIYAIGDVAQLQGQSLSGVAPEALQQGVKVARNLKRQLSNRPPTPFQYFNKGRLAIIGGYAGIGKIGPFQLSGFLPWLMWLGVHLVYLPGYLSRMQVFLTWLNAYIWRDRTVRQRLGDDSKHT
ncbi:MAG: FAD-dependent oxidoreductase, partial [Cyanobacteria bacterium P01_F01_bin.42]